MCFQTQQTMLSLKYAVTKHNTRSIFSSSFRCCYHSSIHYSSSSSSYSSYDYFSESISQSKNDVADSFKRWFRTRYTTHDPLVTRIFQTLSSSNAQNDAVSFDDSPLSSLPLPPLSEAFVLRVLRQGAASGHVLPCLRFFDWAGRQPNFHHTRGTFSAIFRILSRARLMPLVLDFLHTFRRQGRRIHRVRFNDTLVIGYSIAGKPEIALQLFGKMRFHGLDLDSFAYHVLLNALVEGSYFNAFDMIVSQIRVRGFENQFTNALVMKSLSKQGKLDEAERFLYELVDGGKELHGFEVSTLVGALCGSGRFDHAVRLVREFGDSGLAPLDYTYGVWIKGLVKGGKVDEALEFFRKKREAEGYVPRLVRYNVLIGWLLKENRLSEVYDLLMDMNETAVPPDMVTMNAVLCFFCKAGMVDVALELYNSRSQFELSPNHIAYRSLILALFSDGCIKEAFSVLKNGVGHGYFPDRRTFTKLANALCKECKIDEMKELLHLALSRNFMPSASTYDKFIAALCRAGRVEDGYLIHGELNNLTARVAYTKMILGFKESQRGDIAARLLVEMQAKGHKLTRPLCRQVICCLLEMDNSRYHFFNLLEMLSHDDPPPWIYNCFIDGAGYAQKVDLAREVFELMQRNGIEPNLSSRILLLKAYLKGGRISDALNFFNDLRAKGTMSRKLYNCLIVGLCKANKPDVAHEFLIEMMKGGQNPSTECYEDLMLKLCSLGRYHEAINLILVYEKLGRPLTSFMGNALLFHSLASPEVYNICARLRGLKEREISGSAMLSVIVGAFSGHLRVEHSIEDLEYLIPKCFPFDVYTYNLLLRRACQSGMDQACELFDRMQRKGYEPNRWSYDIMVHGFSRHGRNEEAKQWTKEMYRKGFYLTDRTKMLI